MTGNPTDEASARPEPVCPGCRKPVRDHLVCEILPEQKVGSGTATPAELEVVFCGRCRYTISAVRHQPFPYPQSQLPAVSVSNPLSGQGDEAWHVAGPGGTFVQPTSGRD